jgi:tRNA threonylcarbamoyladenosine biosynthesis protein TsaE
MDAPYDSVTATGPGTDARTGPGTCPGTDARTDTPVGPIGSGPARFTIDTPEQMRELGRRLAELLRPGDLVLLTGALGAGKTTLTRGLGEGLGVRGAVTSPTFVIARVHPSLTGGPALVHADAYRLGGGLEEMEDLDLDVSLPESVVVVEWGEGKVEELSEDRLQVVIERALGDRTEQAEDHDAREVSVTGIGPRWAGTDLSSPAG